MNSNESLIEKLKAKAYKVDHDGRFAPWMVVDLDEAINIFCDYINGDKSSDASVKSRDWEWVKAKAKAGLHANSEKQALVDICLKAESMMLNATKQQAVNDGKAGALAGKFDSCLPSQPREIPYNERPIVHALAKAYYLSCYDEEIEPAWESLDAQTISHYLLLGADLEKAILPYLRTTEPVSGEAETPQSLRLDRRLEKARKSTASKGGEHA